MSLLSCSRVNTLFCSLSFSLNFVWLESGCNELGIQRLSNRYRIYAGDTHLEESDKFITCLFPVEYLDTTHCTRGDKNHVLKRWVLKSSNGVTKPLLQTSRTALRCPIHFLLRHPNRRQDRCSLRCSFPENLITCIIACIPHVTHHMQSSHDSQLSHFHEVSELLSQPPPVSIRKTYSHTHNSRTAQ